MESDWFEIINKIIVLMFFGGMILAVSFYYVVNLVKGWVAKPEVRTLANFATAATFSLLVVLLLRFTAGNIDFDAWGLKFKGSSGPIIFWVLCFLASVYGITKISKTEKDC